MRLLYLIDDIRHMGGTQRVTLMKANYFADIAGCEVHIAVSDPEYREHPAAFELSPKVRLHRFDVEYRIFGRQIVALSLLRGIRSFGCSVQRLIRRLRPDIVISVNCDPMEMRLPRLDKQVRFIQEFHYSRYMKELKVRELPLLPWLYGKAVDAAYRSAYRKFDAFVVLTDKDRQRWNLGNACVIANPLSLPGAAVPDYHTRRIVAVGRYVHQKGFDRLLRVWERLAPRYPGWELAFYGPGDSAPYQELAGELGVTGSVRFHGASDQIDACYAQASLFAFPSRYEGFGLVLAEAMSAGLPAVAFDCECGPSDIITAGEDGFLIPDGDLTAFSDALALLMDDAALRQRMGLRARTNIARYLGDNVYREWTALFNRLLEKQSV